MQKFISKSMVATSSIGVATFLSFMVYAQGDRMASADPALEPKEVITDVEKVPPPGVEDLPPPSAGELLAERARALDAREAEIRQAEIDLKIAEKKLLTKIARLEELLEERRRLAKEIKTKRQIKEEARVARMTEVTSKMPPESAALYLAEVDIDTASKILSGIKSRKAAAIFAAMVPSKAAEISRTYLQSGNTDTKPRPTPSAAEDRSSRPAVAK